MANQTCGSWNPIFLYQLDGNRWSAVSSVKMITPNMMQKNQPHHVIIDHLRNAEWDVPQTNQTLSVGKNSEGEPSMPWNKHSLWWKHQFWHQRHVWLTCASLANDWIVNEMYPSREGWTLDKSGFVITAGAVGEGRERKGSVLYSL